jgi:hypothetical protein
LKVPPDAYLIDAIASVQAAHAATASASSAAADGVDLQSAQPVHAWAGFTLGAGARPDHALAGRPEGVGLTGARGSLDLYGLPATPSADSPPQEAGPAALPGLGGSGRRSLGLSSPVAWETQERADDSLDLADPTTPAAPAAITGLAATAGYVLLNTRAGSWLLGALAARPLWRQFDPLEVLFAWEEKQGQGDEEEGESLLSLVE